MGFDMFTSQSEAFDQRVVADNFARVMSGRGIVGDINLNSASKGEADRTWLYVGLGVAGLAGLWLVNRN